MPTFVYKGQTRQMLLLEGHVWLLTPGTQPFDLPSDPQVADVVPWVPDAPKKAEVSK